MVDLAKSSTRWRGELSAHAPLRSTILYLWLDAPGLRAIVGQGESAIRCSPSEHGVAGEGDGYAWTVEPRPDGCKITLELVTKHNAPEDLAWSIDGWQSGEGAIQASLAVTPHPGR